MQGVAPFVQKHLKQEYGVQSVNLSKQSTGLSYPNFFDWPKTIEQTLQKEPDIHVLVVFLGPNDPWDFPMGKKYLKFASPNGRQNTSTASAVFLMQPPHMMSKSFGWAFLT